MEGQSSPMLMDPDSKASIKLVADMELVGGFLLACSLERDPTEKQHTRMESKGLTRLPLRPIWTIITTFSKAA